jgi:hypothetical protein
MNARQDGSAAAQSEPSGTTARKPALQRGAKGDKPQYFDDPEVGKTLSIVLALAGEVSVMRDRMDTIERLLEAGAPLTRQTIDSYLPDESVRLEREARRQEFLSVVLRVIHEERAALERRGSDANDYEKLVSELQRG